MKKETSNMLFYELIGRDFWNGPHSVARMLGMGNLMFCFEWLVNDGRKLLCSPNSPKIFVLIYNGD